jgi:2-C-methyl-D-erythritol 4-phosphate cytidylyltransferase/2-C-methyl-D-erythritol 2,4-cyclodiphosphate synthase
MLAGRPLIGWSIDLFRTAGCSPIVLVVPPGIPEAVLTPTIGSATDVLVAEGADTRQGSVTNGLALAASERVVVHDAARPFATPELVLRSLAALEGYDGAVVAVPLADTLKRVDGRRVLETVPRAGLWRAQTPQAFRTEALQTAHERAAAEGFDATDDAQLVERYGGTVAVVEGSSSNIKLTYPEDFVFAEALLAAR